MPTFAVHDGATILNVIAADTAEIAAEVTGLQAVETTGEPWIGWVWDGGAWVAPPEPEPTAPGALTPEQEANIAKVPVLEEAVDELIVAVLAP